MRIRTVIGLIVLVILIGAGVVLSGLLDPHYDTSAVDQNTPPSQEVIAKGRYLAMAGDCTACHTSEGGAPFAGGVAVPTPFGTIYGTNITPDKEHGIGRWTSADFYRALHDGIAPEHPLYPAMPYTTYRNMSREDSDAIFAYLQSLPAVREPNKPSEVGFPFNLRPLLRGWNLLFLHHSMPDVSKGSSDEWVRGQYLTNAFAHCTECHTPRGRFGQLQLGESFEGGMPGELKAPDITPEGLAKRGWTSDALVQFLAEGIAPQGSAYGQMYEAFHNSTQYLEKKDNQAIVRYLTGDMPLQASALPEVAAAPAGADNTLEPGRRHFMALCAGCHAASGKGKPNVTVALAGNSTVRNVDPHNLIYVVLHGIAQKDFPGHQGRQEMPGFAPLLTDTQVAELSNYLRVAFGGQQADVKDGDVQALRGSAMPAMP